MKTLKKIACVDDEPDMRALIKMSLENIGGYEVQAYSSGREFLDNIKNFSADLIVLDAVMPVMNGLKILEKIHELDFLKEIPVLFMTGGVGESPSGFMAAGAIGVVAKPFDPLNLPAQIQIMWEAYQNGSDA